jgi:FkbM family methyltransferase
VAVDGIWPAATGGAHLYIEPVDLTTRMHQRFMDSVIEHAAWSIPPKWLERLRDAANYGLGAGSAAGLPIEKSGEAVLLKRLAALWADRDEVIVLDVGAHHGEYASAALEAFDGRARIECFEPDPLNYTALTKRLGSKVGCHALALGDVSGTAWLFTDRASSPLSSMYEEAITIPGLDVTDGTEVEVDTLDRVTQRIGIGRIDLLKIDVEGHELAVLKGGTGLLDEEKIDVIQFEFGERNIASRTYLRDFRNLLPRHHLFRLSPRGPTPLDYQPSNEVFVLAANYIAARRATPA